MIFLQEIVDTAALAAEQTAEVEPMNLWTMATYGGWIMVILALMLALAVYIFVERLLTINKASKEDASFMDRIKDYVHEGKIESALNLCNSVDTPTARMVGKGLTRIGRPMSDVLVAVENVGNLEVAKLEKSLVVMASISSGAPMLGFLGTVIGMVNTFYGMSQMGDGGINMDVLSSGMYQAMVTTIGGLIVGILAYFAYNYLVARVDSVVRQIESYTMEFLDLLNEPA